MSVKMFPFVKALEQAAVINGKMRVFKKNKVLPTMDDLSCKQRRLLPGQCTHLEWVVRQAFGKDVLVLLCWIVGCKKPLKWDDREYKWVDDSVYR